MVKLWTPLNSIDFYFISWNDKKTKTNLKLIKYRKIKLNVKFYEILTLNGETKKNNRKEKNLYV